jgi:predicted small lipoprotein YifL
LERSGTAGRGPVYQSRMRMRTATALLLALAAAAASLAACTGEMPIPLKDAAAEAPPDDGARATCSSRSFARFPGAFTNPANLVVGPLALVGGATPTSAATVEAVGGQKYPLLVRAGHEVTVELPPAIHGRAALGYGPLPQGEITVADGHERVTFTACDDGGDPTFWSGFLLASEPACVPLDVFVDDEATARRAEVELGRAC